MKLEDIGFDALIFTNMLSFLPVRVSAQLFWIQFSNTLPVKRVCSLICWLFAMVEDSVLSFKLYWPKRLPTFKGKRQTTDIKLLHFPSYFYIIYITKW